MCKKLKFYHASSNMLLSGSFEVGNFNWFTAISIKVVHEQSGKHERERLLGIALKIH